MAGPVTSGIYAPSAGGVVVLSGTVSGGTYSPAAGGTVVLGVSGAYTGSLANLTPPVGSTLVIVNNTSSGTLNVAGGAFLATSSTSFGPATLEFGGGTLAATTALTGSNALANPLVWGTSPASLTIGGTNIGLSSALALNGGVYTINDPKGLANFSGLISGAGTLASNGNPTFSGPITGGTFLPASGSSVVLSGAVSGGTFSPTAGGAMVLSGTYSGLVANLAPSGGTLVIADNTSSGTLNVANGAFFATNSSSFGPTTLEFSGGTLGADRGPDRLQCPCQSAGVGRKSHQPHDRRHFQYRLE